MRPILELHVPGLREAETLTFRIEPFGPNEGPPAFLSPAQFSIVSGIIDRASKEPSPNWHEARQAILSAFYEAKIKRV
jgi:hypothetical protein